jgi:hypothetical protein
MKDQELIRAKLVEFSGKTFSDQSEVLNWLQNAFEDVARQPSTPSASVEQVARELQECRNNLQQVTDERDSLRLEFEDWKSKFHIKDQDGGAFVMQVWLKCLGGQCAPKSHLIDGLAKTTRQLVEQSASTTDKDKDNAMNADRKGD